LTAFNNFETCFKSFEPLLAVKKTKSLSTKSKIRNKKKKKNNNNNQKVTLRTALRG